MWGDSFMIAPVYEKVDLVFFSCIFAFLIFFAFQGKEEVDVYLPPSSTWYSLRENDYGAHGKPNMSSVSAKKTELIPVYLRGQVSAALFQFFASPKIVSCDLTKNVLF